MGKHRSAGLCAFLLFVGFLGFTQPWSRGGEGETVVSPPVPDLLTQAATPSSRSATGEAVPDRSDCVWFHNPGNPSCLTIGIAAQCAIDATGPDCRVDSDGDHCTDVAEAEAGFDPFDAADCVSGAEGRPAINCLFQTENLACNGDHVAEPEERQCTVEQEMRQRGSPSTISGCNGVDQPPLDECVYAVRDPGCDGFSPGESG